MISISEIQIIPEHKEVLKNKRNATLKELYALYISQPEINKQENRKRYHEFIRLYHREVLRKTGFDRDLYDSFKPEFKKLSKAGKIPKEIRYVSYLTEDRFWFPFRHLTGEGGLEALEHMVSVARDKLNRYHRAPKDDKHSYIVSKYILGAVK